ncbi:MAG: PDZ domain-containing protein [Vicinamibacterales bacterium]
MRISVALAAAGFLVVGYLLRPEQPAPPPQQEPPAPLLQEVVQQREAGSVLRALQEVGAATLQYGVFVTGEPVPPDAWSDWQPELAPRPEPPRYGVVTGAGEVIANVGGLSADAPVQIMVGNGRQLTGRITEPVAPGGLARIAVTPSEPLVPPSRAASLPAAGDPVVAAAPAGEGSLIAPLFVASITDGAIVTTTELAPFVGAPVFSASRELIGMVANRPGGARVVPIDRVLDAPADRVPGPARLGLTLAQVQDAGAEQPRVVVRDLDPNGRAAAAGVMTDDVIEAIDDAQVASLAQARGALPTDGAGLELNIRRGRRALTVRIPAAEAQP